jgi:hypothetical protein
VDDNEHVVGATKIEEESDEGKVKMPVMAML